MGENHMITIEMEEVKVKECAGQIIHVKVSWGEDCPVWENIQPVWICPMQVSHGFMMAVCSGFLKAGAKVVRYANMKDAQPGYYGNGCYVWYQEWPKPRKVV